MTRRRLSREEIELWQKVVEQAERLNRDRGAAEGAAPPPKPARPPSARRVP